MHAATYLLIFNPLGAAPSAGGTVVSGPFWIAAACVYVAGAQAAQVHVAGAQTAKGDAS